MAEEQTAKTETKLKEEAKQVNFSGIKALVGKKLGMGQVYSKEGRVVPVTMLQVGPCTIVQIKTKEKDGYTALQVGFGIGKKMNKPMEAHLKKANIEITPKYLREIKADNAHDFAPGQEIKVDIFKSGEIVDVTGVSIGKGHQGTVKRHHFHRGPMSHGSKCHRLVGSIGAGTSPGRVEKGTRMAGRMGGDTVTQKNLEVIDVRLDKNLLLLKGAVPGPKGSIVVVRRKA